MSIQKWIRMISRSLILQILQAAKIMRRFFYGAPAEIMRIYTTINLHNYYNLTDFRSPIELVITCIITEYASVLRYFWRQNIIGCPSSVCISSL